MTLHLGKQVITIHVLPNISKSKDNQRIIIVIMQKKKQGD